MYKLYRFSRGKFWDQPELMIMDESLNIERHTLTPSTYNRFAEFANNHGLSQGVNVEILGIDEGVAWSMHVDSKRSRVLAATLEIKKREELRFIPRDQDA